MNIRHLAVIIPLLCLIGCATPSHTKPITKERAYAIATEILRERDIVYQDYGHDVIRGTNYWFVSVVTPVEFDDHGRRTSQSSMPMCGIHLDLDGHLLAIIGGGQTNQEEITEWEDNLFRTGIIYYEK